jgi:putative spermidine/putrescine transport system permease protein
MNTRTWTHIKATALVLPLVVFLAMFFVWPIVTMLKQSVSDPAVHDTLKQTAKIAVNWNGKAPVPPALHEAFVNDLRGIEDRQKLGAVVRRLNSAKSGFRTLMRKTDRKAKKTEGPINLVEVDKRWGDASWWRVIAQASSPYTDRYLLASLDHKRDKESHIVALPKGESANLTILGRTFLISFSVMIACLCIGLPYAMILASAKGWCRNLLLAAVLLPLWTSLLVRTTAWFIILQNRGLINMLLQGLGIIDEPIPLIFQRSGLIIAMTHVLLPFMVLPIYSILLSLPKNLMSAASSLGAHPVMAFLKVLLPLSARGIASGCLLVFMSSIGYYITPALIGGPTDQMISSVIAFYATETANWGMAGALGLTLLTVTLILYVVYARLSAEKRETS